jgi:ABC-type phosphate transport system substrate-binding protein
MRNLSRIAATLAASGALLATSNASAADCNFSGKNVVFVTGSSASSPYLASLSAVLAAQSTPVTLVYIQTESCQGVTDFLAQTPLTSAATYWTPNADGGTAPVSNTCNFSATSTPTSAVADVGVSDVYSATCGATLATGQQEFAGPVQAIALVVNPSSTEQSISQEAAHVVFKDIATASQQISPWTDPAQLFIRQGGAAGSGTRAMIGATLGFVDADWSSAIPTANVFTSSGGVLGAVAGDSANASKSLGILSVTKADGARPGSSATQQVRVLAFQAKGQSCGYLPDSTASSFDKLNVREGRYDIWGPLHFVTAVSGGSPVSTSNPGATGNAAVQAFFNLVTLPTGSAVLSDAQKMSVIAAAAKAHVVAQCAMRVQRTAEVGPEMSFLPPESCGCYWESVASGAAPASCSTCSTSTDCATHTATPTCRYGFCEAN